jgi:hypothetical protein
MRVDEAADPQSDHTQWDKIAPDETVRDARGPGETINAASIDDIAIDDIAIDETVLDLPADLSCLAEQLRDDAEHLAKLYPPGGKKAVPAGRWKRAGIAAAVVLIALGALGIERAWRGGAPVDNASSTARVAPMPPNDRAEFEASEVETIIVPVGLYNDLTCPEQEGLLDLLDDPTHLVRNISL